MQLDFNKINNQVIKTLFDDKNNNLILTGSYALYNVHLPKLNNIKSNTIKIKDLDLDIFKIIKVNNWNTLFSNNNPELNLIFDFLNNKIINKINKEFEKYENIVEYNVEILENSLRKRDYNKDTFGLIIKINLINYYNEEYELKLDINFENKNFKTIDKEVMIDDDKIKVKVYELEKQLADKYLAVMKRFNLFIKTDVIDKKSNYWKISKDLYDINYILQNSDIDNIKTNENTLKMTPNLDINDITKFKQFIKNIIVNKTNIKNFRGYPVNLDNEINKYKELFKEKIKEL